MSIDELVHTCAHEEVATAAVFSIGLSFAGKVAFAARSHDVSVGAFVAQAVRLFAINAQDAERRHLAASMRNQDQPLLAGLHCILAPILEDELRAVGYATAMSSLGLANRLLRAA
jgi:hypothetical protein